MGQNWKNNSCCIEPLGLWGSEVPGRFQKGNVCELGAASVLKGRLLNTSKKGGLWTVGEDLERVVKKELGLKCGRKEVR